MVDVLFSLCFISWIQMPAQQMTFLPLWTTILSVSYTQILTFTPHLAFKFFRHFQTFSV